MSSDYTRNYININGKIITRKFIPRLLMLFFASLKRLFDVIVSFILIIILLPLMLLICILIKIDSKGPIFFKQERTGFHGKKFKVLKFRSMVFDNDVRDLTKEDEYTRVGKIIRKLSLDEIPQLFNILSTKMSFIGPRPWIPEYYDNMNEIQRHRCDVRPGLTGFAQVMGRNNISIQEKITYDLEYIKNYSLHQDIKIIFLTIKTVFSKKGAYTNKNTIKSELNELKRQNNMSIKKTVLVLANDTTYVYNLRGLLIKEMLSKGFKVYVVAQVLNFEEELKNLGCSIINVSIDRHNKGIFDNFKIIKNYKKVINNIMPDVAISYNIKPNIYGGIICSRYNIKYMPNITGLGTTLQHSGIISKLIKKLYKFSFKKAKVVFFQNKDNMNYFEKNNLLNKNTKHILLPGSGVDLNEKKVLKYPKNKNVKFLFVGRIMKDKGIENYLEAAKFLKENNSNVEFHICGYCDDDNYKEILNNYSNNKIVNYHGEQKVLTSFYKNSDCVVLPSYHEGMSNVLLEAAALARPIICSDIPGCKEIVKNNKTGFLVPVNDTEKLITAMKKIINMSIENRQIMGLNGRKKIEKEFDRKIVVDSYMKFL